MNGDRRGSWYLLTGVILGVALGLIYAWVIDPVEYVDAPPSALRQEFKEQYQALVAAAYLYSGDLARAEYRLAQLEDPDIARSLTIQAQRALAEGRPEAEIRALGLLAVAIGQGPTPVVSLPPSTATSPAAPPANPQTATSVVVLSSQTPTPTTEPTRTPASTLRTPQPTRTPLPTFTPSPSATAGAPFLLQETLQVCDSALGTLLIQLDVRDAAGQPVPGVEAVVTWDGHEEHFFTGLKPELGMGYADFTMTPGVVYTLALVEGGQPVSNLSAPECLAGDGSRFYGSWLLLFVQP